MASEFDELQELVLEDARKVYSETTIDHFMKPRSLGDMEDADGFGRVAGSCGDTMPPRSCGMVCAPAITLMNWFCLHLE